MWYVYSKHLDSGKEYCIGCYSSAKETVAQIAVCYQIDANTCMKNECYYFMKQH